MLDHILLSAWFATQPFAYDVVHVNSEFAVQTSDHEPQVVRLTFWRVGQMTATRSDPTIAPAGLTV